MLKEERLASNMSSVFMTSEPTFTPFSYLFLRISQTTLSSWFLVKQVSRLPVTLNSEDSSDPCDLWFHLINLILFNAPQLTPSVPMPEKKRGCLLMSQIINSEVKKWRHTNPHAFLCSQFFCNPSSLTGYTLAFNGAVYVGGRKIYLQPQAPHLQKCLKRYSVFAASNVTLFRVGLI